MKTNQAANIVNRHFLDSDYQGKDWEVVRLNLILEFQKALEEKDLQCKERIREVVGALKKEPVHKNCDCEGDCDEYYEEGEVDAWNEALGKLEAQLNILDKPEQLKGESDFYHFTATEPFDLYVNVLVPDIENQKKDVSASIMKDGKEVAVLNGVGFEWEKFFEEFGHDTYWKGPEYKAKAEAGEYEIRVWSSGNDSKYSLAIGEIEAFDLRESLNALGVSKFI